MIISGIDRFWEGQNMFGKGTFDWAVHFGIRELFKIEKLKNNWKIPIFEKSKSP